MKIVREGRTKVLGDLVLERSLIPKLVCEVRPEFLFQMAVIAVQH